MRRVLTALDSRMTVSLTHSLTLCALTFAATGAAAGPNSGGVLLVHAETSIVYTDTHGDYCGAAQVSNCADIVTTVPADPETKSVFYVMAAFPADNMPSLKAVSFGVQYDPDDLVVIESGNCGDFAMESAGWPSAGTGVAITWTNPVTTHAVEVCWFVGYATYADSTSSFSVASHPTQGAYFADGATPPSMDPVAEMGALGFGQEGYLPNCNRENAPPAHSGDLMFVELAGTADSTFTSVYRDLRADYQLDVLVAITPNGLFCRGDEDLRNRLASDARVALTAMEEIPNEPPLSLGEVLPGDPEFARRAWNAMLISPETDTSGTRLLNPTGGGCLANPEETLPPASADRQTSIYLTGEVGITLLIMESELQGPGYCEPDTTIEDWTYSEIGDATQAMIDGWTRLGDLLPESPPTLLMHDIHIVPTSYEPITMPAGWSTYWIDEAWDYLGYGPDDHAAEHNNLRRSEEQTDWWFTTYLVRDVCDPNHLFAEPYPQASTASRFGPSMTLLYVNGMEYPASDLDNVFVHESMHIFGAPDEYWEIDLRRTSRLPARKELESRGLWRQPALHHARAGQLRVVLPHQDPRGVARHGRRRHRGSGRSPLRIGFGTDRRG